MLNFGGIQLDYEEMGTAATEEFHGEAVELEKMMNHMKISWMIQGGGGSRTKQTNKSNNTVQSLAKQRVEDLQLIAQRWREI